MGERLDVDICVIGAGSGGLSVAAGAVQMGARVALIEKHRMGGDCLNYGCVPSKALLAAAHAAQAQRDAARFGIAAREPEVDFARVRAHVRGVIAAIAPTDSVERFAGLGVTVILGTARFAGPNDVIAGTAAGETRIRAKWIVIATGSRAAVPPIPGLDTVPYLTNETIFDLDARPDHLVVIGGGPIGIEMAQAHRRLGAKVSVLEMGAIMPKDDPELVDVVRKRLLAEGVALFEKTKVLKIETRDGGIAVAIERDGKAGTVTGSHLLVAAGRAAQVEGLDLDKAGIAYTKRGIAVDARLRSSNKRVFAVGDAAGGYQFTHVAGYHAGIVIRQALFRLFWSKADLRAVPWATYTDPELAHVGLSEAEAKAKHGEVRVLRWPFHDNDRAQAERATEGFAKIVTSRKGRVLGADIVGRNAGELIHPWVLAVQAGTKISKLAGYIAPYPTFGEVGKRAAGSYFTPALFSPRTRRIVRLLLRLP
ncbi:MAG: FAD-dependent oxidoreductase [Rhodospirillaceae bacterium]|nr:FAD-dependent oxidoreductase [Rhodospirillaceae bacterium]